MKRLVYGVLLVLPMALPSAAQPGPSAGTMNFQYHEPIPQNGDLSVSRAAILSDAERDCASAQKAFGLQCLIGNIQFNNQGMPGMGYGFVNQVPPNSVSANVNMMLVPAKPGS
ncbi:MAG: hypothetical protein PHU07_10010 [Acidocella sp.]|nr:hypothetical protein [Acidocella sp.]